MAKPITTDPSVLPRPFTLVAAMLQVRTGQRVSPQAVEQCHRRAMEKMRKAFEAMRVDGSELR